MISMITDFHREWKYAGGDVDEIDLIDPMFPEDSSGMRKHSLFISTGIIHLFQLVSTWKTFATSSDLAKTGWMWTFFLRNNPSRDRRSSTSWSSSSSSSSEGITTSDPISGIVSPFFYILSSLIEFLVEVLFIFIVHESLFGAVYSVLLGDPAASYLDFMGVEMVL